MPKNTNPIPNPKGRKRSDYKTPSQYYKQLALDNGFKSYHQLEKYREQQGIKQQGNRGRRVEKTLKDQSKVKEFSINNKNYGRREQQIEEFVRNAPEGADIQFSIIGNVYGGSGAGPTGQYKSMSDWVGMVPIGKDDLLDEDLNEGETILEFLRRNFHIVDRHNKNGTKRVGVSKVSVRIIDHNAKR